MKIKTIFFDLGGVILTNAWDQAERARAVERFNLEAAEFEARHRPLAPQLEVGAISLDQYLGEAVFYRPRAFSAAEFRAFMESCSQPLPGSLELLQELSAAGRLRLATLNNEGSDLNEFRIARFGLARYFSAFCSSCYLGARKPEAECYRRALGILQAAPEQCLFVDDREENLLPARALGMEALRFTSAAALRAAILAAG
ncbi:MAG: HAD family hydrolase [Terriglobales bacterium]